MGPLVDFEQRVAERIAAGQRVGMSGGGVESIQDGHGVRITAPVARGGALIVHKNRDPEMADRCTKCGGGDVVIQVGFPGGDGEPLQFCRSCVDRQPGKPLVIQFRS